MVLNGHYLSLYFENNLTFTQNRSFACVILIDYRIFSGINHELNRNTE